MSLLVNQNFEGTGFDHSESWYTYAGVNGGVVDPDYATSPLLGSQSLRMHTDIDEGTYAYTKFSDDTGKNALYGFARIKFVSLPPSRDCEVIQTMNLTGPPAAFTGIEHHEMIWIRPTGALAVNMGPEQFNGSTLLSTGTVYYLWWYMSRGSDLKSSGWVKVSASPSIPVANEISWTNQSVQGDGVDITLRGTNTFAFTMLHSSISGGYEYIADQTMVSESPIMNFPFGSFPTTGVLDDFNRTNGALGSSWTVTPSGKLSISSNRVAAADSATSDNGIWNGTSYGPGIEAYIDIPVLPASGNGVGLYACSDSSAANAYLMEYLQGTGIILGTWIGGTTFTQIGSTYSVALSAGDSLGFQKTGNVIAAWRKTGGVWSQLTTWTDSTWATGYIGLFVDSSTTARLDNFGGGTYIASETVTMDKWFQTTQTPLAEKNQIVGY